MSFCLNYLKFVCLAGFLLLGIFCLMIFYDVETLHVEKEKKSTAIQITGITSGVFLLILKFSQKKFRYI